MTWINYKNFKTARNLNETHKYWAILISDSDLCLIQIFCFLYSMTLYAAEYLLNRKCDYGKIMNKQGLKAGITAGLPVFAGYFPVAVTFGLMAASMNISLWETLAFSVFVFAGACQFVALNMIQSGAGAAQAGLAVFLLNFRHLLMSASLWARLEISRPAVPLSAAGF